MSIKIFIVVLGITILGFQGCGLMSKKYIKSKTDEFSITATGKKRLKLDNITGSISISRSNDSAEVSVKAVKEIKVKKKYLNTPFDEITVRIDTVGSLINIQTDIKQSDEDGIFKLNLAREHSVDYEIKVPSNIEIEIENVNGTITLIDLNNDVKLDLVNGDVSLEGYTGLLECDITNGDFSGRIDSTRGISISTINGSVSLFLNSFMSANIRAESVNSKITEENLNLTDVIREKKLLKGRIGNGPSTVDIKVETVNGKVRLYGRNEI